MGRVSEKVILRRIGPGFASGECVVLDGVFELFKGLDAAFHIAPPGIIQPNPAYYMPNPSGRF
jgi:hypothetical protein